MCREQGCAAAMEEGCRHQPGTRRGVGDTDARESQKSLEASHPIQLDGTVVNGGRLLSSRVLKGFKDRDPPPPW